MINKPCTSTRHGLAPASNLTLVQHNSLGSWDVFLSLFSSLAEGPPVDFVLLQDPPSSKGFLPSYAGFKYFAPPIARPRVACYVSQNFLPKFAVLPFFPSETDDFMALDVFTPEGCFGSNFPRFRIGNAYARPLHPYPHSVSPDTALQEFEYPYLVAGDFNIHNSATDPSRLLSTKEEKESAPYFALAADLGFTLLNTPGIYTRFPFTGTHRPSTIDLAFANPRIFPAFRSWDASVLPSLGSDHAPILISLCPPSPHSDKPRPRWQDTDWPGLTGRLRNWQIPPPLTPPPRTNSTCGSPRPSPRSRRQLRTTLPAHAPPQGPSPGGPLYSPPSERSSRKPPAKPKSCRPPTPTPQQGKLSLATSRPSKGPKLPTGLISSQRPPRTTSGRPNSWSPQERPPDSPPFPMPPTLSQSTTHSLITSFPLKTPSPVEDACRRILRPLQVPSRKTKLGPPSPKAPPRRPLAQMGSRIPYGKR